MNRSLVSALLFTCALQACDSSSRSQATESRPAETSAAAEPASSASAFPPAATNAAPAPAATAPAEPASAVRYQCENGMVVLADYEGGGADSVRLAINDKTYSLTLATSASGARYQTSDGLTPGKSLVWWSKGSDALLIEAPSEQNPDAEVSVNCQELAAE